MREIPASDLEGDGKYLTERASGEEFEVVTSFVDLADPKVSGAVAFTIRDSLLVPLRPKGWEPPVESSYASAQRFIEEVRGDERELAIRLRIEERELAAGGVN